MIYKFSRKTMASDCEPYTLDNYTYILHSEDVIKYLLN